MALHLVQAEALHSAQLAYDAHELQVPPVGQYPALHTVQVASAVSQVIQLAESVHGVAQASVFNEYPLLHTVARTAEEQTFALAEHAVHTPTAMKNPGLH